MDKSREANSFVLNKAACPKCRENGHDRSGDNLAVYSDGHKYCFRCGYISQGHNFVPHNMDKSATVGPEGWSNTIPERAYNWLTSYELSLNEILNNKIQWDESRQLLIFPVYSPSGDLVMYQGRYFGENEKHPKYLTFGPVVGTYNIHWCSNPFVDDCVVVVEDFISAIKVSRVVTSMPMFGSNLNTKQIGVLATLFSKIIWWLDPDKQGEYPKLVNRASLFFDPVHCVYSDLDPKYYSTKEIECNLLS